MPISKESVEFLFENNIRNSRAWFRENRGRYKALVETPMLELAEQLMPTLLDIDPLITSEPKRCLSRIWRDMRINRSGMFFRDNMWLSFRREKGTAYPAYYFDLSPQGFEYGVGYYIMPTDVRNTVHKWVLENDRRFLDAKAALGALPQFKVIGEEFKRKKYPDAAPEQQAWLNRKNLSVIAESKDADLLFSDRLGDMLADAFEKLAPVYRLLLDAHLLNAEAPEEMN